MSTISRHVLVIDGDADTSEASKVLLELWGYRVSVATDGARGLRMFLADRPDVVLLDLRLPGTDGFEVTRSVRAVVGTAHVTIVALTGLGRAEDRRRAAAAGCDAFFLKPADLDELREAIRAGIVTGERRRRSRGN